MVAFLLLFVALSRTYREMFRRPESRALLVLSSAVVILGAVFYHGVEHWSWLDAFYFCVVTLGTVGYGDLTPTTPWGKVFTMVYIIVGLSIIGGFFATAGQLIHPVPFLKEEKSKIEADLHTHKEKEDGSPEGGPAK
jgi:voltage-gated potassium channel